jgi:hypothetical protein
MKHLVPWCFEHIKRLMICLPRLWPLLPDCGLRRPGHMNDVWGYWTDDGLGLHELLQMADDVGARRDKADCHFRQKKSGRI